MTYNFSTEPDLTIDDYNPADMLLELLGRENNLILADEVMVCDSQGVVLSVSETYETHFGVSKEYVIGKTVYQLEQEGIFKPSVTAMVIAERKKITTTQSNKKGQIISTTGIPIFSPDQTLKYVVCFNSIDISVFEGIQRKYNELKASLLYSNEEIQALRQKILKPESMIIRSNSMTQLWANIIQVAATKANVLITGETGVGKSIIAREIHLNSQRAGGPFVEINCAVIHENLIESELFGYERGAFTGASQTGKIGKIELSNGGTLFLDEIGELPLSMQAKLLQVIQQKSIERISGTKRIQVDFRLIVATNRNLEEDIKSGLFRKDLYYRLNVFRLHIPPLRERKADIVPLAIKFLERFNSEYGKNAVFSPHLLDFLEDYSWPGNVRELENLIERMDIINNNGLIDLESLPADYLQDSDYFHCTFGEKTLPEMVAAYEMQLVLASFKKNKTSVAVAKDLGISQTTAARKLRRYISGYNEP